MFAGHTSQAEVFKKRVRFSATAGITFLAGQGLCYDRDRGTATDCDGSRDAYVELPSTTNNRWFAGVLLADVTIPPSGAVDVDIGEPKSVVEIALGSDAVVDTTVLNCVVGCGNAAGRWRADKGTGLGRGAAIALQTNASGNIGESIDGTAVVATKTITDTGLFANAAAGDYVVIMASSTAAGAAGATPGIYEIASVTNDNVAVLTTAPGDGEIACYVISGNPTCLAYLCDGSETGLIEWIEMLNNAASQSMVGGYTHMHAGVDLAGGDCTATLANGLYTGQRKGFQLHGAVGTNNFLLTTTTAVQRDGSTALASIEFDADGDTSLLQWKDVTWVLESLTGVTLA